MRWQLLQLWWRGPLYGIISQLFWLGKTSICANKSESLCVRLGYRRQQHVPFRQRSVRSGQGTGQKRWKRSQVFPHRPGCQQKATGSNRNNPTLAPLPLLIFTKGRSEIKEMTERIPDTLFSPDVPTGGCPECHVSGSLPGRPGPAVSTETPAPGHGSAGTEDIVSARLRHEQRVRRPSLQPACCWHCSWGDGAGNVLQCLHLSSSWFGHGSTVCVQGQRPRGAAALQQLLRWNVLKKEGLWKLPAEKLAPGHPCSYPSTAAGAIRGQISRMQAHWNKTS